MQWKQIVILVALAACASLSGCDAYGGKKRLFDFSDVKQDQNTNDVLHKLRYNDELTPEQVVRIVASAKERFFSANHINFFSYILMAEIEEYNCLKKNLKWWDGRCETQPYESLKRYCKYCHDKLLEYCKGAPDFGEKSNEWIFHESQRDMMRHGNNPNYWF